MLIKINRLTFFRDSLCLRTLNAFVLGPSITRAVYGHPRMWIALQLNSFILTGHFTSELIWNFKFIFNGRIYGIIDLEISLLNKWVESWGKSKARKNFKFLISDGSLLAAYLCIYCRSRICWIIYQYKLFLCLQAPFKKKIMRTE